MSHQEGKIAVAKAIAARITSDMTLAIGEGSTVALAVRAIGARIKTGELKNITGVAASLSLQQVALEQGLRMVPFDALWTVERFDLGFDGADEVDAACRLIKGGGGHLLQERVIADRCIELGAPWIILVDSSKLVEVLGAEYPLPVEVETTNLEQTIERLRQFGEPSLRLSEGNKPFSTSEGNHIVDLKLRALPVSDELPEILSDVDGVIDHGLFFDMATEILIANGANVESRTPS